jgi:hypothetical protein
MEKKKLIGQAVALLLLLLCLSTPVPPGRADKESPGSTPDAVGCRETAFVCFGSRPLPPIAPESLTLSRGDSRGLLLTWQEQGEKVDSYNIWRKDGDDHNSNPFIFLGTSLSDKRPGTKRWSDPSADPNRMYTYRVQGHTIDGPSSDCLTDCWSRGSAAEVWRPRLRLAVFRPSNARWFLLRDDGSVERNVQFGSLGDVPVPGDYLGAGYSQAAVYRPTSGEWCVRDPDSRDQSFRLGGLSGDEPLPGDYLGLGKTQMVIRRRSNGQWLVLQDGKEKLLATFGTSSDIAAPGNYNGDGITRIAVYRPSEARWYVLYNLQTREVRSVQFGAQGDQPVPGDYGLRGQTEPAVYRHFGADARIRWFFSFDGGRAPVEWGALGDQPVPGTYSGGRQDLVAVYRASTGEWWIREPTGRARTVTERPPTFPDHWLEDKPVPAAYIPASFGP